MRGENEEKPKIIVDDDWKSKVEAEREALRKQTASGPAEPPPAAEHTTGSRTGERKPSPTERAAASDDPPLPLPTFTSLTGLLATQAMILLGEFPDPFTGQTQVRLNAAKHQIDTLAMLEEKTQGNLNYEERSMLAGALHQLRMAFVERSKTA